jgi:hypothetical protein
MRTYWLSGGITPRILNFGTRWRWVVIFTPRPLYPQWKIAWYPLDRRLGGPKSRSWRGGEEKNSQPLPGLEPSIVQPVSQCYTDWAIPASVKHSLLWKMFKISTEMVKGRNNSALHNSRKLDVVKYLTYTQPPGIYRSWHWSDCRYHILHTQYHSCAQWRWSCNENFVKATAPLVLLL